jgi:hypothetical protein
MDTAAGQEKFGEFLGDQGSFTLSLIVGMVVIAFYARKRMEEFIHPPKGEEYDFTKMLTLDTIVGSTNFYKSYIIYVLMLEFLYFFLCSAKPVILLLANDPSGASFQGAAWPLGAALLVVGLLPSTPAVAQVETMLRGLAQHVANIPEEFYSRVTQLTRSEVETIFSQTPEYRRETRRFEKIRNLLACLGFTADDATRMARTCTASELFAGWTIYGARFWSAGEFEKYTNIISVLRPKSELLSRQTDELIAETEKLDFVKELLQGQNVEDISIRLTSERLDRISDLGLGRRLSIEAKKDEPLQTIVKRWNTLASESDTSAKRLSALFSIIARNDTEATRLLKGPQTGPDGVKIADGGSRPDPVVSNLIALMDRRMEKPVPWAEAVCLAGLAGFIFCTVGLSAYYYAVDWWVYTSSTECPPEFSATAANAVKGAINDLASVLSLGGSAQFPITEPPRICPAPDLTGDVRLALASSITLAFSFGFASLVALFLRSLKIEETKWDEFKRFTNLPVASYLDIIGWCSMAAFMPLVVSYVGYYYASGALQIFAELPPSKIISGLFYKYLFAFSAVAFAIATCWIADLAGRKADPAHGRMALSAMETNLYVLKFTGIVVLTAAFALIAASYALSERQFWSSLAGVALFGFSALYTFFICFASHEKGEWKQEHSGDGMDDEAASIAITAAPAVAPRLEYKGTHAE